MKAVSMKAKAVAIVLLFSGANAFWRMPCKVRSGYGRLDPLIAPGKMASHAHAIHGSSGFGPSADYAALRAGDCTSCQVEEDKSAYWTPSLYFEGSDGSYTLVNQVGGMLAYYFLNAAPGGGSITAFPAGFQMIAGDTDQRNFTLPVPDPQKSDWAFYEGQLTQTGLAAKATGFNCLNYGAIAEGSLFRHFLPTNEYLAANCPDGLRLELMFPSCWNGKDITSANFRDHVAYPDLVMNGDCPPGFPTRLPGLFFETIYDTYAFAGKPGRFVLSNGDPTGYGYHGDFLMGWDEAFLQKAVNTCTNPSGKITDCPIFTVKSDENQACNYTEPTGPLFTAYATEDVYGPMKALPGNCPVEGGPERASGLAGSPATGSITTPVKPSTQVLPTLSYSPGNTASVSGSYVPGDIFAVQTITTWIDAPSKVVTSTFQARHTTVAPVANGPKPYTTIYSRNSAEVVEMVLFEETVTVSDWTTTTVSSAAGTTSTGYRKRHLLNHARRAHNRI